jgi:uncharacterized membrane protein
MALLLEEVELRGSKLANLYSESGEIFALGAIAAGFHLLGVRHATFIDFHVFIIPNVAPCRNQ